MSENTANTIQIFIISICCLIAFFFLKDCVNDMESRSAGYMQDVKDGKVIWVKTERDNQE